MSQDIANLPYLLMVSPKVLANFGLNVPILSYSSWICGSLKIVPGGWDCNRSTSVANKLMFSASPGLSSWSGLRAALACEAVDFAAALGFDHVDLAFCSSMSLRLAAIAAFSSSSSSSSGALFCWTGCCTGPAG